MEGQEKTGNKAQHTPRKVLIMENEIILLVGCIGADKQAEVKAIAFNNQKAQLFITASSLEEAKSLFNQGQEMAKQSMKEWKPKPQKAQEEPQKALNPKEEAQEELKKLEATEAGRRVIQGFNKAEVFNYQKDSKGINTRELTYLFNLAKSDCIYSAIEAAYNLGFQRGYNRRRKEGAKL